MRLLKDIDLKKVKCDECKGKPDRVYGDSVTGEVIAIICDPCRIGIEATIKVMGEVMVGQSNTIH